MKTIIGNWTLSHTKALSEPAAEKIAAHVPGAVQLDYAEALNYPPYYYGTNFRQFFWMEDEYFISVEHPMTKDHFISFVAFAAADRLQLVKFYPEGNAQTRFKRCGHGFLYICCNRHGLYKKRF